MLTSTTTLGTTKYFFTEVVEEGVSDILEANDSIDTFFHEDMYQFCMDHDVQTSSNQRYF